MKSSFSLAVLSSLIVSAFTVQSSPVVVTTSGIFQGAEQDGVISFKGIPFGQPPVGSRRWEPPQPFLSSQIRDATALGPACLQQFLFATQNFSELAFNTPPPPGESEDCLYLNVWAPLPSIGLTKPVVVWIYGGSLEFGTGSLAAYDGASFVKNQDIVVVTFNYRTNVFGFPGAEELYPFEENLGFLDQDLALQWVQANIAVFGGDPKKVTIMGESAGADSVAYALQRHSQNIPFRAAIMQSGAALSMLNIPNFASFGAMAKAVNCTQSPGAARLSCLKTVPADVIHKWANGPQGVSFGLIVDNVTIFANPFQRIHQKLTARVPILIGANQDDGTLFTVGQTSLTAVFAGTGIPVDLIRAVYPGLNDTQIIPIAFRDLAFACPAALTSRAFVQSGITNVFRYMYGAVFADLQLFPGAGAWHSSEIREIFGTFNSTTATPAEETLSQTMQTVWANFIKDPTTSPASNWETFLPGNNTKTLAKLAYQGNVQLTNVVEPSPGNLDDGPCDAIWNSLLDF